MKKIKIIFSNIFFDSIERSILLSLLCKPISMIVMLIYTPILLHFLGEEVYGIWVTILSIVNWINYFDVGIGNGLRNILTVHVERGEYNEVKKDVSTAYVVLSFISFIVFFIGSLFIMGMDDHLLFNTSINVKVTFEVSFLFICINFILSLSKILFYATHQAEKVSVMALLTQIINLCGIVILSLLTNGNMLYVAILVGMSGMVVYIYYSIRIWCVYPNLVPDFRLFAKDRLHNICNIGLKFFLIQISGVVLYSTDNMIITHLFGPSNVTPYQTVHSAFGIVNALYSAAISPLWAQYTVAKERRDYKWVKKIIKKLEKSMFIIGIVLLVECMIYRPISFIWLQKELNYDMGLIFMTAIYNFFYIWASIYVVACNGMGRINLQLYLSIAGAVLNIPLSLYLGYVLNMRSTGVLLATILCMLFAAIPMAVDTHRYLFKMCDGKECG